MNIRELNVLLTPLYRHTFEQVMCDLKYMAGELNDNYDYLVIDHKDFSIVNAVTPGGKKIERINFKTSPISSIIMYQDAEYIYETFTNNKFNKYIFEGLARIHKMMISIRIINITSEKWNIVNTLDANDLMSQYGFSKQNWLLRELRENLHYLGEHSGEKYFTDPYLKFTDQTRHVKNVTVITIENE